jgi:hypothetical protein
LSTLDEHAERIGPIVDFQPSGGDVIRYYKFRDYHELQANGDCGSGAGACAIFGKAVLSPSALDLHELAHIYTTRGLGGPASALLEEGFAVALSCQPWLDVPSRLSALPGFSDFRAFLNLAGDHQPSRDFPELSYPAAGMFVTYLVHHYGWERVQALYRAIPMGASAEDFERAFAKTLPISADDAWRAALSADGAPYCLSDWLCDAPSIAPGDADDTSCLGQVRRTFDVRAGQAGVVVSLTGNDTVIVDCGARSAPLWLPAGVRGMSDWVSLKPGHYALANLGEHPERVRLAADFANSLFSERCESAPGVMLSADEPTFIDLLPNTELGLGFLRVNGHGQRFTLQAGFGLASPNIRLCSGCGNDATCTLVYPLPMAELPTLPVPEGAVLRIERATTRSGWPSSWAFGFYPASDAP